MRTVEAIAADHPLAPLYKQAQAGDKYAQYELGYHYELGKDIAINLEQAVVWYRNAAEQNHAIEQFTVSAVYAYGRGVAKDKQIADQWYERAANNWNTPDQYSLGLCHLEWYSIDKTVLQTIYRLLATIVYTIRILLLD